MSYDVHEKLGLKILFNTEEFLFGRANSLVFLHMVCSTKIAVPMLHLSLQDNLDFLSEFKHLSDAARIQIVLSARGGPGSTYVFRLNSYRRTPQTGGYRYEIDGYLDASTYWHASSKDAIAGTSYKVIKQIASTCGLAFSGDQTADAQTWIPRNIRYHEWARLVSERGYRSDNSCMQLGLNFDKTLTYRDLSAERVRSKILVFGEYRKGMVTITDAIPDTSAGSMNHYSGYSDVLVEQDLQTASVYKVNSQVSVNKQAGEASLMVNSKVKGAVSQAKVTYAPIDAGNSHPQYERALYQNRRINNLFSSRLQVVTQENTDLKLMDKVSVTMDTAVDYLKAFSGDYLVASRAIHVQGNEYFEKLELLRKSSGIQLQDAL